jgi:homocysteine S-methyltransferase
MKEFFKKKPFTVLDGGLATTLESKGADLKHKLWSAKVLKESPELIFDTHFEFMMAGADIILTSSYQASVNGFKSYGLYDREARETIFSSVMLACYARDKFIDHQNKAQETLRPILIGGSCGPYGAILADGSEYNPHYIDMKTGTIQKDISATLVDYYQTKIEILLAPRNNFRCDFLAFETLPSVIEAQVIAAIMKKYPGARYWLSFSNPFEAEQAIAKMKTNPQIIGFGLNCVSPQAAIESLPSLKTQLQGEGMAALVVYPNSGSAYDPSKKEWSKNKADINWGDFAKAANKSGATVIGGCCQTTTEDIKTISSMLSYKPLQS